MTIKADVVNKSTHTAVIYIGRRFNGPDIVQAFQEEGGKEIIFKGIIGVILGCSYEYTEAGKMSKHPKRLEKDLADNPAWEAQDALVEDHLRERRAEAKVKGLSRPAYRNAVEAVRPLLHGLNGRERSALIRRLMEGVK